MAISFEEILDAIDAAFDIPREPLDNFDKFTLKAGSELRPGLSAKKIVANIISRQSEAGAPGGDIFSKNSNVMESMLTIIVEEIISGILLDAKIEVSIDQGIQVKTDGANAAGPVTSIGQTLILGKGAGVIR